MPEPLPDDLIARIRARAADPETRTDASPTLRGRTVSVGPMSVRGLDVGAMLRGDPDPTPKPATDALPGVASAGAIAAAEAALGFSLPEKLRQLYTGVADGGYGPGAGLMSLAELARTYRDRRGNPPGRRGQTWPAELLPFTRTEPGHDCIDIGSGKIIVWDEEALADGPSDRVWKRSFKPDAPDLGSWFERWLAAKSPEVAMKEMMEAAKLKALSASLAYFRAMTPQQRAEKYSLPEEGWEQVMFGHLGVDLSKL